MWYLQIIETGKPEMFVIRNIRTHEIVETGFVSRSDAEAAIIKWVNKDWGHYEAYPADVA